MSLIPSRQTARSELRASETLRREKASRLTHRILLIDDDPLVVETLEHALRSVGHEVRSTMHGKDVFRLLELLSPDFVISDIVMSDIDPIDTIAKMRRSQPRLRIIAISGNPHLLRLAEKHGAHHVLAKPFRIHRLHVLLRASSQ